MIKNATFSGYYFYMNSNIWWDFQICISVPLTFSKNKLHKTLDYWSRDILHFDFLEKGLRIVSPPHYAYDFSTKDFLMIRRISIRLISVGRMTHFAGKCFLFNPHLKRMKVGLFPKLHYPEAVVQRCSVKQVFLEISQNTQCQSLFLNKVAGLRLRCFGVNFVKLLRTPFYKEHLWWLLQLIIIKKRWKLKTSLIWEAATGDVLKKIVFLNFSQISQENTCAGVSF